MNAITSIYIPRIESVFKAKFIANVFNKNGIAKVSKVIIKPIKNNKQYNCAYIVIKSWQETEAAYSFIERLRNPKKEARIIYKDDNWWPVDINPTTNIVVNIDADKTKLLRSIINDMKDQEYQTQQYRNKAMCNREKLLQELDNNYMVKIDAEKTKMLRNIINKFKDNQQDCANFNTYMTELDELRRIDKERQDVISKRWVEKGSVYLFAKALFDTNVIRYDASYGLPKMCR